jgi:HSP20 family molecular chaperone IbpA
MNGPKLVDAISRLFDEMVRDPWSRPVRPAAPRVRGGDSALEIQVPIAGAQLGEVSVAREQGRLVVRARVPIAGAERAADAARTIERVVTVPADTEVSGIEARFEDEVLRVRVNLRAPRGE